MYNYSEEFIEKLIGEFGEDSEIVAKAKNGENIVDDLVEYFKDSLTEEDKIVYEMLMDMWEDELIERDTQAVKDYFESDLFKILNDKLENSTNQL